MSVRPIVRFPDARLRLVAEAVEFFDSDLRNLANDLLETMRAAPGIGITAPHIGVSKRVVVLQLTTGEAPRTYVNPVITWVSADTIRQVEGSVSMPGVTEEIERYRAVRVAYQDTDGNAQVEDADGLRAVCHQHEIDQLDGVFWLQRLSPLKRERLIKKYRKLERNA
ncbi:peptide deformylase [Mesorhizobium sp. LHD-90]|uniref:peptide deformylase n=1 Tax=Mesorhizobium sp. LHD-90 TaxID=3071414 RepID=UPI0027DF0B07|nr:peptide deformylase [Mesorhizobium sp. LHD-90]MDQ6435980.1 peptide deformylase [Mesorhizobium sp. LHD-90]